jgi:hypothetical protein
MNVMTQSPIPASVKGEQLFVMINALHCDYCNAVETFGGSRHLWTSHNSEDYCPSCASELLASL